MDLFYQYDIERLRHYANISVNTRKISIESTASHLLLCFTDVGYFNYCVCHEPANLPILVKQANVFYTHRQIEHHKLLIEEAHCQEYHYQYLVQNGYCLKERLVAVRDTMLHYRQHACQSGIQLEPVCEATMLAFTKDYLAAFESEQPDSTLVSNNFSQLLRNQNITLFRVTDHKEAVGIAVLYRVQNDFVLAGGAILPTFRHKGYHTAALVTRLNWSNSQKARSIIAWAYHNSVSYRNMLKVGLTPYKTYRVYER
ncbi:hypothetical protein EXU85_12475 [Spirosoma sp. KCTC 42546]|uniref:hypothetical protein n=1 Tax=Spirosoma sp. KCTC 42546 TaxID=2520506 RepID=UPI00115B3B79|nr:hypothetical protein [Spirosoma sp. KCTC 42546]QDK79371.1 hypothetical protein EXU85_12475 [Spirosoma sp. KCTC 42546]